MPIRVRYQNDPSQECTIRPTPLISINSNVLKDGAGEAFGVTYTITLNGTLLPDEGLLMHWIAPLHRLELLTLLIRFITPRTLGLEIPANTCWPL